MGSSYWHTVRTAWLDMLGNMKVKHFVFNKFLQLVLNDDAHRADLRNLSIKIGRKTKNANKLFSSDSDLSELQKTKQYETYIRSQVTNFAPNEQDIIVCWLMSIDTLSDSQDLVSAEDSKFFISLMSQNLYPVVLDEPLNQISIDQSKVALKRSYKYAVFSTREEQTNFFMTRENGKTKGLQFVEEVLEARYVEAEKTDDPTTVQVNTKYTLTVRTNSSLVDEAKWSQILSSANSHSDLSSPKTSLSSSSSDCHGCVAPPSSPASGLGDLSKESLSSDSHSVSAHTLSSDESDSDSQEDPLCQKVASKRANQLTELRDKMVAQDPMKLRYFATLGIFQEHNRPACKAKPEPGIAKSL